MMISEECIEHGEAEASQRVVLLVEPNVSLSESLCKALLAAGIEVIRVSHPRQALEAATCHDFDVAVIDTKLPEMDGIDLMERLQRLVANLRTILVSGHFDGPTRSEVHDRGGFDLVYLPCPTTAIEAVVEHALHDLERSDPDENTDPTTGRSRRSIA